MKNLNSLSKDTWGLDDFVEQVNSLLPNFLPEEKNDGEITLVTARLVRLYTTQHLLDEPEREGKSAVYTYRHLIQMLVIRRLLSEGLNTTIIEQSLKDVGNYELEKILENGPEISVSAINYAPNNYQPISSSWTHIAVNSNLNIIINSEYNPPSSIVERENLFESIRTILTDFFKGKKLNDNNFDSEENNFEIYAEEYSDLLDNLLKLLERLPKPARVSIEGYIKDLIAFTKNRRSPRFMVIGRRGSGKSSLINAIFVHKVRETGSVKAMTTEPKWEEYSQGTKSMMLLDTVGLREGNLSPDEDRTAQAKESILNAVRENPPDATIWVVKAKEVDAAITIDIADLEEILKETQKIYRTAQPLLVVVSQCDELDPPKINLPTDNEIKNNNIRLAVSHIEQLIASHEYLKQNLVKVIPTAAYAEYQEDCSLNKDYDYRWNIETLVEFLLDKLPTEAKLDFVRITAIREFQKDIAKKVIDTCCFICGTVGGLVPIPIIDVPVVIGIQITMIIIIAYISGRKFSYENAWEFFRRIGLGAAGHIAVREIAGAFLDLIPFVGDWAAAGLDVYMTRKIGQAAITYFIDKAPVNLQEMISDIQGAKIQ